MVTVEDAQVEHIKCDCPKHLFLSLFDVKESLCPKSGHL